MRGIEQLVAQAHDGAPVSPIYLGGVTDGRYWRQRGTVVYGATLLDSSMTVEDFASLVHGTNERVSVGSLEQTLNFFYRLPDALYRGL
jgi:acetylornithine deacetylase/succinyl-diaminopimelate desuccinylase-like protein